ncbi:molecular chaperone DnaK [Kribbella antibiotica]|uniref:Molecular chaperone DnaK n=1 Tax=Kribbella antibiotica TaxID=190195 RepID=A0A4R4ZW66_9ACTN|nr:TraR/DksA C4-type zinc finger protein [Kribbella antibiotica]TDD61402.1 molecular chaperone DnaK [Kribbella antibiotica]
MPPDLTEFRDLLTADRERTRKLITALTQNVSTIVEASQLTATDDEHDPEGATIAFERSQTSALLAAATSHLADVDLALAHLTDGTYGVCEHCGTHISPERLLARPAARTCITCAEGLQ